MKLAVISDTHGNVSRTTTAIRLIEHADPDIVIHCGDVGTPAIVWLFSGRETHFVMGNVDDPTLLRPVIEQADLHFHNELAILELPAANIAVTHGDDHRLLRSLQTSGDYDLICTGHTHLTHREKIGPTWVLNPGAIHRATVPSFAFVTIPDFTIEIIPLIDDAT